MKILKENILPDDLDLSKTVYANVPVPMADAINDEKRNKEHLDAIMKDRLEYYKEVPPIEKPTLYIKNAYTGEKLTLDESLFKSIKEYVSSEDIDDTKYEYFIYVPDDKRGMNKISRDLMNKFGGSYASRKGYLWAYIAPDYETADEALDYAKRTYTDKSFDIDKIERKEKPKYVFDLDDDLWTKVYDDLTRTQQNKAKSAGYDYSKTLKTDINGNILVYGHTIEDLDAAIDVAKKHDVKYEIDPYSTGMKYLSHMVRIHIPDEDISDQYIPDNRIDKSKKKDQI